MAEVRRKRRRLRTRTRTRRLKARRGKLQESALTKFTTRQDRCGMANSAFKDPRIGRSYLRLAAYGRAPITMQL
jgi:hypothetical protein